MPDMTLKMLLLGQDVSASRAMKDVGKTTDESAGRFKAWHTAASAAGVIAGAAVVKFGADSVRAYADSQEQQAKLQQAFQKFPALADTNITALRQLNSALEAKTGFDDDATASGQAVLAQFGLTGKQIASLTPLLQDYASRTGKDIPAAAQDLGKAVLGQGRALKNIGLNFKDTHDKAGNFNQLMTGLRANVGGFAEQQGKTAAGQTRILGAEFGELQETVGSKLVPTLTSLVGLLIRVVTFVGNNITTIGVLAGVILAAAAAAKVYSIATGIQAVVTGEATASTVLQTVALGALKVAQAAATAAQWLFNAALTANPIGLVIAAIALLVAGFIVAWKHSETFRNIVKAALHAVLVAAQAVGNWFKGIGGWIKRALAGVGGFITRPFTAAFAIIMAGIHAVEAAWNAVKAALGSGGPSVSSLPQSPANRVGLRGHAAGGIFTGPTMLGNDLFGEAGPEAVIPLASGRGRRLLGSGGDINITINGAIDPVGTGKQIEKILVNLKRNNQGRALAFQ